MRSKAKQKFTTMSQIYNLKTRVVSKFQQHSRDRVKEIDGPAANLYDCIMFWKEFDLLELRLNELSELVDYFVIVEATETFQGDEKKLHFEQNKERFAEYEDKIIHHVVEYPEDLDGSWEREDYLRNSIHEAIRSETSVSKQDEIIISDADEIPSSTAVQRSINSRGIKVFSQSFHWYYYNYMIKDGSRWFGSVMSSYDSFTTPQDFRDRYCQHHVENPNPLAWGIKLSLLNRTLVRVVSDGGWHFSYIGDTEYIVDKLGSFAHAERNTDEYTNRQKIQKAIENGIDFANKGWEFEKVEFDDRFPNYLLENRDKISENMAD